MKSFGQICVISGVLNFKPLANLELTVHQSQVSEGQRLPTTQSNE